MRMIVATVAVLLAQCFTLGEEPEPTSSSRRLTIRLTTDPLDAISIRRWSIRISDVIFTEDKLPDIPYLTLANGMGEVVIVHDSLPEIHEGLAVSVRVNIVPTPENPFYCDFCSTTGHVQAGSVDIHLPIEKRTFRRESFRVLLGDEPLAGAELSTLGGTYLADSEGRVEVLWMEEDRRGEGGGLRFMVFHDLLTDAYSLPNADIQSLVAGKLQEVRIPMTFHRGSDTPFRFLVVVVDQAGNPMPGVPISMSHTNRTATEPYFSKVVTDRLGIATFDNVRRGQYQFAHETDQRLEIGQWRCDNVSSNNAKIVLTVRSPLEDLTFRLPEAGSLQVSEPINDGWRRGWYTRNPIESTVCAETNLPVATLKSVVRWPKFIVVFTPKARPTERHLRTIKPDQEIRLQQVFPVTVPITRIRDAFVDSGYGTNDLRVHLLDETTGILAARLDLDKQTQVQLAPGRYALVAWRFLRSHPKGSEELVSVVMGWITHRQTGSTFEPQDLRWYNDVVDLERASFLDEEYERNPDKPPSVGSRRLTPRMSSSQPSSQPSTMPATQPAHTR